MRLTGSFPCSSCKECLSDLAGTYLLVLIGPGSIIIASLIPGFSASEALAFVALSFGGAVTLVILLLGRHSGAHVNPAVTLAHSFARITCRGLIAPYFFFQILGGLLAGTTLRAVFGSLGSPTSFGSTTLAKGVSPLMGLVVELSGTFLLSLSALMASTRVSSPIRRASLVGATLFLLILIIGPLTGAGFNPARTFGPSIASGQLENQFLYWVGPLLGAGLAGLTFGALERNHARRKAVDTVCVC